MLQVVRNDKRTKKCFHDLKKKKNLDKSTIATLKERVEALGLSNEMLRQDNKTLLADLDIAKQEAKVELCYFFFFPGP